MLSSEGSDLTHIGSAEQLSRVFPPPKLWKGAQGDRATLMSDIL